ncbi:MAG: hypothetical protein NTW26_03580 [bacterium]|nr:hypothetical protein [bacterium]
MRNLAPRVPALTTTTAPAADVERMIADEKINDFSLNQARGCGDYSGHGRNPVVATDISLYL